MTTKLSAFDAAEYLDSEEAIAAYLNEVVAEDDPDLLLSALEDVARARGMSRVAEDAGLTRPGLYKALKPGSKAGFSTVRKLVGALGLQVHFVVREDFHAGSLDAPDSKAVVRRKNRVRKRKTDSSPTVKSPESAKARA